MTQRSQKEKQHNQAYDMFSADLPMQVLEKGHKELTEFVNGTLTQLIHREEEILRSIPGAPPTSSLRWIGRVDVGILHDQTSGKMSYWVIDIKQCHCTPLYTKVASELAWPLAPTLVQLWEIAIMARKEGVC